MSRNGEATKRKAPEQGAGDSAHIAFSIKGQDGRQLYFKVNRDSPFIKAFRQYCERMNLEYAAMRFLYDGHRVNGRQTAKKINLENNDEILAVRDITGGGVA